MIVEIDPLAEDQPDNEKDEIIPVPNLSNTQVTNAKSRDVKQDLLKPIDQNVPRYLAPLVGGFVGIKTTLALKSHPKACFLHPASSSEACHKATLDIQI